MAFITCNTCGKNHSDRLPTCPHCTSCLATPFRSYVDMNLMPDERLVHFERLHWIIFAGPTFIFLLALLLLLPGEVRVVGAMLLIVALASMTSAIINYKTSEFGVTTKRVIVKVGFIRRNSIEILLSKVEGVQINQSILGRILDYGTIVVTGTGGSKNPFLRIARPLQFRQKAQEQIESVNSTRREGT